MTLSRVTSKDKTSKPSMSGAKRWGGGGAYVPDEAVELANNGRTTLFWDFLLRSKVNFLIV